MRANVIGTGTWGTALAQVLADNGYEVMLYGRSVAEIEDINKNHRNSRYFGDTPLSEALCATADPSALFVGADIVLIAVPSRAFPDIYPLVRPLLFEGTVLVNAAKGFEPKTGKRLSVALCEAFSGQSFRGIVSLIGPSHAEEVILRMLTSVCAVSADPSLSGVVQAAFSNDYFRVYSNEDTVGAELGVAVKNVIALASGMLVGRGYGDNAKAALITRGLAETVRYGVARGGRRETFFGLAGVGDLIVTCFSPHSRNYRAGLAIGQADSAVALKEIDLTVEGVDSCREVYADAHRAGVEMPIVFAVYSVLFEGVAPSEAIKALMRRPLKSE